jgi:hypothetical protein
MIHIIQCLCPQRHCILAVAYDDAVAPGDEAMQALKNGVQAMVSVGLIDPWCGFCESRELFYEDRITNFATMEEAQPALKACETEQLATAARRHWEKSSRN